MDNIRNKSKEELLLELQEAKKTNDSLQVLYQKEINEKLSIESKLSSDRVLSELMFQEHSSVMLLIDPLSGKIIDANKSAVQFYKYPVDQLRGMLIDEINVLSHEQIEIEKERAINQEQNLFVFPHRISSGEIRQVEVHSSPVELNGQKLLFSIIHDITEREAIDSKLKKSEDTLRKAEEIGKFGNWYFFLNEKLLKASEGARIIYGFGQEELPYEEVKDVAISEYRLMLDKALSDLVLDGKQYDVEYKIKRKSDGKIVDIHSIAEFDPIKNIVFGTIQDISERKRIEEAMIESEDKFYSLFANMIEGAALHNLSYNNRGEIDDYVIIDINPAFEGQLGITRERVINKKSRDAYGVADPPFLEMYARVALSGNPEVFETYFPPLEKYFSVSVYSPYKGSFATIFVDITERKTAEHTIRESERRYHGLLDHLDAGIVVHAADTSVIMANPKAQELLGLKEDQMTGKLAVDPLWKFLLDDLSPMPLEEHPVNKIISSKKPLKDFLIGVHRPATSDVVWLLVNGLPTLNEYGGINEVLISFTDITERKSIEDNLLESQLLLHEAQRLAQIGVWNWDNDTNTVTWSEELCKIVGRDPDLPVPAFKDQQFVFTPESYRLFSATIENVKESGRKIEIELEVVHADGSLRNVTGFVGMKYNTKGLVKGLYGTLQDITERKLTEMALAEREELYRLLFENSGEAILYTQPDGTVSSANPEACRIFGRSEEEIIKHGRSGLIDTSDPKLPDALEKRRKTGQFKGELDMLRNDGAVFPAEISSTTFKDSRGVEKTSTIIRDITKRKLAEEALRESKNRLNQMLQSTDQGIYGIGLDGCGTFINQSATAILGYTIEECIGWNMHDLVHHSHPDGSAYEENECPIFKAKNTGKGTNIEDEVFWRKDGTSFSVEYSSYPTFENGEVTGAVVTFADITKRRQIETALRESEERFRKMADLLPQIIFETDVNGNFTYVNKQAFKIFGYPENYPIVGINSINFHAPEDKTRAEENIKGRITDKPVENNEYKMQRKDGSSFQALVYSNPILKNNKPVGLRGIIIDISDRKRVEEEIRIKNEELLRVVAEKNRFFSIIAHDLRSPFNGFLGLTQIMAEKLPELTMDEIQKIAVSMRTSATSLFRLLENLLHWARIEQGLIPLNATLIHLLPVVTESIAMSKEPALKKGIEMNISVSEDIEVFADTNMLQTVIRNLISNAVKYTTSGGKILLSAKAATDKSVEISVQDSGIGMDDDILANLFHINLQTNRKGTDDEPSTGLGLIICKEFVEKHGGKLKVESKAGTGSTFRFTIPGTNGPLENTTRKNTGQTEKATKPAKGLKILIAEDDETSEMLISIALKSLSREILKVSTGYEAVEVCKNNPDIDLIMMDIKMPGMDGYEAARQIRHFNKDVFIVAQTAFGKTGESEKAISEGFNEFLSKPLSVALLKELITKNFTV